MTRGRGVIAGLLILSLLATFVMRQLVHARHDQVVRAQRSADRLSGLDTFALGLILGGLRGPLVMVLWTTSETQKMERNLEDFDTKIDLIRMLQPEFDSVHIFQVWNKAYNISVQMASLQNKYATILDALRYAREVDAERPHNVNVLTAIADVYFTKLGTSAEKRYYNLRMREDTQARSGPARQLDGRGIQGSRHAVLLDESGYLLPELLAPSPGVSGTGEYTGAELQFLEPYNTTEAGGFPYGVSPLAVAYNYFKRAAVLQKTTGQKHLYMSEAIIDSRAPVALREWAVEKWDRGRRLEIQALGHRVPDPDRDREWVTASVSPTAGFSGEPGATRKPVGEALFSYRRGARAARHAEEEYRRHVRDVSFEETAETYMSQIDNAAAMAAMLSADHDYLLLMAAHAPFAPPLVSEGRISDLRASAAQWYQRTIDRYYLMILKYYVDDEVAAKVYPEIAGRELTKRTVGEADPSLYPAMHAAVRQHVQENELLDMYRADIEEYEWYIERARRRLEHLQ